MDRQLANKSKYEIGDIYLGIGITLSGGGTLNDICRYARNQGVGETPARLMAALYSEGAAVELVTGSRLALACSKIDKSHTPGDTIVGVIQEWMNDDASVGEIADNDGV